MVGLLENYCSFQHRLLTDVNTAHSGVNIDALFTLANSMVISSVLDCERVWTLTVYILNTICNRDCFADCSLDLTLTVSFWKITFLVSCWKQIIISRSWNWTHLQFSAQCSNGCQCVLWNFQWFLFSIMSVTVLYLGGRYFGTQCI